MSRKLHYDTSVAAREVPLRPDEVEALILSGGHAFSRDSDAVVHLLHRVAATLRQHRDRVTRLQADVDRIRQERADARTPMVRAMNALNEMTPEEHHKLLDARYLAEVDKLRGAQSQAELEQAAARNEINRVRLVLAELLDDPDIDQTTRQRIAAADTRLRGTGRGDQLA